MRLSVVVPVYNEEEGLQEFHDRLSSVLLDIQCVYEILYVNDGSRDETLAKIEEICRADSSVAFINLSRNFGKEAAMSAGLDHAEGDAVVVIDADLQDPPELIPEMVRLRQSGYDTVYGQRSDRLGESFLKKFTAKYFYRFMANVGRFSIPQDTGDFRLLSRRAVLALRSLPETNRFMKGLFAWIGYSQIALPYVRDARYAGDTKFNYWKLWNFALDGVTSFTTAPLKLATYVGLLLSFGSFSYGAFIIFKTLFYGDPVRGYPSLMAVILFLGGVQLLFLGVIGEYLGRMFDEAKCRPLYFVDRHQKAEATQAAVVNEVSVARRINGC